MESDRLIKANANLNSFLRSFIDSNFPAYPYDFGEQAYWRNLFNDLYLLHSIVPVCVLMMKIFILLVLV